MSSYAAGFQEQPRIFAVERLTIKERLSRLFTAQHRESPVFFEEPVFHPSSRMGCCRSASSMHHHIRTPSTISEKTLLTPVSSHFDLYEEDDDSASELSMDDDDESPSDDESPVVSPEAHRIALSVAILPAAVAAATAARARRYQARARKAAARNGYPAFD